MKTFLGLVLMLGVLTLLSEISSQPPQYNNIKMEGILEGVERLHSTRVSDETVVILPTVEYLNRLETLCSEFSDPYPKYCLQRLNEVKKGQIYVNSQINPLYGRPPFDEKQLAYVVMGSARTFDLLEHWEREFAWKFITSTT